MRKHTTVILVTYCINDTIINATKKCFEQVIRTTNLYAPHTYEIMFVDNGSREDFKEWLRNLQVGSTHIKVIWLEGNPGFAKAANVGMAEAVKFSDFIILLNNDTIPRNGWLWKMIQVAESDPKIAMVGAKIIKPGTDLVLHSGTILKDGVVIDPYSALTPNHLTPKKIVEERLWINGACMLIKADTIKKFGLFDDETFKMYFEEADYMIRLHQAGYRVVYAPMVEIEHYEKLTAREIPGAKDSFYANWQKILQRHYSYFQWKRNLDGCPKVAFIMPTYNSEQFLARSIVSALMQSYANFRFFIVDDASADTTREIIEKYKAIEDNALNLINYKEKSCRIFPLYRTTNGGAGLARNGALNTINFDGNAERIKYVFFLDSDDIWEPRYVERMVWQLEQNPDVDMMYSLCDYRFEDGSEAIPYGMPSNLTVFDKELMLKQNYIHISFVAVKLSVFEKVGNFYEGQEMNGIEDWDMWSRIAKAGFNIKCYPELLGVYTVRNKSNAGESNAEKLKLLRERQK